MLDNFGITFSCIALLIVIVTAAKLEKLLPWFEAPRRENKPLSGLEKARANAADAVPVWRRKSRGR